MKVMFQQAKIKGTGADAARLRASKRRKELESANGLLQTRFLQVAASYVRPRHLPQKDYIQQDKRDFNMANADALEKIWPLTSVRLICDIFLIIAKQTATVNTNLSLLFELPNVFEPLADHMDKCRPGYAQLTTHAFPSAEVLIDHLTSVNAVNFVCKAAMDEDMPPGHKAVYQIVSDQIVADAEKDPSRCFITAEKGRSSEG